MVGLRHQDARKLSSVRNGITIGAYGWTRCAASVCAFALALVTVVAATAAEPIPEPDAIFTGRIGGLSSGVAIELRWNGTVLDHTTLQGERYVLQAPLVSMVAVPTQTPVPTGKTLVGQRPELWANGVRQGSVLVQDRGTVFETSFFTARASDPNPSATAVPLAQSVVTPVLPTAGPSPATPTGTVTATSAATRSVTPAATGTSASPTETPTATPTATGSPVGSACTGDCDGDAAVAINELILAVNIALGSQPLTDCPVADAGGDGMVTVNELIAAVNNALNGCEESGALSAGDRSPSSFTH